MHDTRSQYGAMMKMTESADGWISFYYAEDPSANPWYHRTRYAIRMCVGKPVRPVFMDMVRAVLPDLHAALAEKGYGISCTDAGCVGLRSAGGAELNLYAKERKIELQHRTRLHETVPFGKGKELLLLLADVYIESTGH